MTTFKCTLKASDGKKLILERTGPTEETVLRDLSSEGYFVLGIQVMGKIQTQTTQTIRFKDLVVLTKSLAQLLSNGLSLVDAVSVGSRLQSTGLVKKWFIQISTNLAKGQSLSEVFSQWKGIDRLYLGLVKVGEKTGKLNEIFVRLSLYLEKQALFRQKFIGALVYPIFVLSVAVLGMCALFFAFFPMLEGIVASVKPQAVVGFQNQVNGFIGIVLILFFVLLLLTGGVLVGHSFREKNERFRLFWDQLMIQIPIIKASTINKEILQFTFAMESLLLAGYTVEKALSEGASVIKNMSIKAGIDQVRKMITEGSTLASGFRSQNFFTEDMKTWLEIGEASHDLAGVFGQLHNQINQKIESQNARVLSLLEPGIILFTGLLLIILITQFILPIFQIIGKLS